MIKPPNLYMNLFLFILLFTLAPLTNGWSSTRATCEKVLQNQTFIKELKEIFNKYGASPKDSQLLQQTLIKFLPEQYSKVFDLTDPKQRAAWALRHAATYLNQPPQTLMSQSPTISVTTASEVIIIKNRSENAESIAALKIFGKNITEFFREVLSLTYLNEHPILGLRPVKIFEIGLLRVGPILRPYILLQAAAGIEIEALMKNEAEALALVAPEERHQILNKAPHLNRSLLAKIFPNDLHPAQLVHSMYQAMWFAGQSLAKMHQEFYRQSTPQLASAIEQRRHYDADRISNFLNLFTHTSTESSWIAPEELLQLRNCIDTVFARIKHSTEPLALVHGDGHQGNLFFHDEKNLVYMIDTERFLYSLDPRSGPAEIGTDLGRLYEAIEVDGLRFNLPYREIRSLQRQLIAAYGRTSGIPLKILMQRIEFFRLRFDSIAIEDVNAKKYDSRVRCHLLHYLLRRYGIRHTDEQLNRCPSLT